MRGVILSADAALSLSVAVTVLATTLYYMQSADENRWDAVGRERLAYDIGLSLGREGVFSSGNRSMVEDSIVRLKPASCLVSVDLGRYVYVNGSFHLVESERYGDDLPGDRMVQRVFSYGPRGYYVADVGVALR